MPRQRRRAIFVSYARFCLVFVTLLSLGCTFSLEDWLRCIPRARREWRRNYLVNWRQVFKDAQRARKFRLPSDKLHVHVISLLRLRSRSRDTFHSLEKQGVSWVVEDAVDGLDSLNMRFVSKYAGPKKQQRLIKTAHFSSAQMLNLKNEYDLSKVINSKWKLSLHERLRFGCYMSHVTLWEKAMKYDLPFAVILEDDVVIEPDFSTKLRASLAKLPYNWDIFYLNGCFLKFGPALDAGVRLSYGGLCTFAYAISRKGIRSLLRQGALQSEMPIDHVLDEKILAGHLLAFHASPPLVQLLELKSTLAY